MRNLIIGAGGHAQVVADILWRMREHDASLNPVGYLDDNPALAGQSFIDLPVLGAIDRLGDIPHEAVVVAIGNNQTRRRVFDTLRERGERIATAVHPSAVIAPSAEIGVGCMVCAGVNVRATLAVAPSIITTRLAITLTLRRARTWAVR